MIADLHLGHEWAKGEGGDCVPAHSLAETIAKLGRVFARPGIDRLVIAGDVVESGRPCARTAADFERLVRWVIGQGKQLVIVAGNHDRSLGRLSAQLLGRGPASYHVFAREWLVDVWTIAHGHQPVAAARSVIGHLHPVVRASGHVFPCYLMSAERIVLPAFSGNIAGLDLMTTCIPNDVKRYCFCCFVATDEAVLDFGPLKTLRKRASGRSPSRR